MYGRTTAPVAAARRPAGTPAVARVASATTARHRLHTTALRLWHDAERAAALNVMGSGGTAKRGRA